MIMLCNCVSGDSGVCILCLLMIFPKVSLGVTGHCTFWEPTFQRGLMMAKYLNFSKVINDVIEQVNIPFNKGFIRVPFLNNCLCLCFKLLPLYPLKKFLLRPISAAAGWGGEAFPLSAQSCDRPITRWHSLRWLPNPWNCPEIRCQEQYVVPQSLRSPLQQHIQARVFSSQSSLSWKTLPSIFSRWFLGNGGYFSDPFSTLVGSVPFHL